MTTIILCGRKNPAISNPYLQRYTVKTGNVTTNYEGIAVKTRNYNFDESDMLTAKRRYQKQCGFDPDQCPTFYVINL